MGIRMKRAVDMVLAGAGLILFAPLFAVIAALIVLESGRPVFFRVERIGFGGRPLRMLKFRKMRSDAGGKALTTDGDARLTRVGRRLMRHRLDELPQLWHVLRGEMSLVGPRPEHLGFVARHTTAYSQILQVRPGITGWSQLAFADECAILDPNDPIGHYVGAILPRKVALDYFYASECNMRQDLGILFATFVTVVLRRPVVVSPSTGRLTFGARARALAQGTSSMPSLHSSEPVVAAPPDGAFKA
jgi:lipopolysaccharide/colanic/teichoic acid biosynthesis glycosyltransferase